MAVGGLLWGTTPPLSQGQPILSISTRPLGGGRLLELLCEDGAEEEKLAEDELPELLSDDSLPVDTLLSEPPEPALDPDEADPPDDSPLD